MKQARISSFLFSRISKTFQSRSVSLIKENASIISEDVIDVFEAMGIKRPEVSILSEEFLNEVREMKQKNLAVEMLKKLLEGNIKAMERRNVV